MRGNVRKVMEDNLTDKTFERNYKNHSLLKIRLECGSINNDKIHKWIKHNYEEQLLTTKQITYHTGNGHL